MAIYRQLALCRRIKGLRVQAKKTQNEVAKALEVSQAAYSRLETGEIEITMTKLFELCDFYNVDMQSLLEGI